MAAPGSRTQPARKARPARQRLAALENDLSRPTNRVRRWRIVSDVGELFPTLATAVGRLGYIAESLAAQAARVALKGKKRLLELLGLR